MDESELDAVVDSEDEEDFDLGDQEWDSLRDDSGLCNLLCESDVMNVDKEMEELDQSEIDQISATSLIENLVP